VYALHPYDSEGELHTSRQKYISNQQLCSITSRTGLPGYIQVKPFNFKSWMPPGMQLEDPHRKAVSVVGSTGSTNRDIGKRPKNRKKHSKQNMPLLTIASKVATTLYSLYIGLLIIFPDRG